MASRGKNWNTKEQSKWLKAREKDYVACMPTRKYDTFWKTLYTDWQLEFPLVPELFPGRRFDDLSDNEKDQFKDAWETRRKQLKAWYRWRFNPRNRSLNKKVGNSVLNKVYNRNRKKRIYSIFASIYPDVVEGPVNDAYKAAGVEGRQCLPVWTKVVKQLWKDATQNQRQKVNEAVAEERRAEEEPKSPEEVQQSIDAIPAILTAMLGPLSTRTKVAFFVSYIGQHPREGGRVRLRLIQFGEPEDSPMLVTYWRNYEEVYGEKVAEYYAEHVQRDTALEESMAHEMSSFSDNENQDDEDSSSDEETPPTSSNGLTGSKKLKKNCGSGSGAVIPDDSDSTTKKIRKHQRAAGLASSPAPDGATGLPGSGSTKPIDDQPKPKPRPRQRPKPSDPVSPLNVSNSDIPPYPPVSPHQHIPPSESEGSLTHSNIVPNNSMRHLNAPVIDASHFLHSEARPPQNPAEVPLDSNLNPAAIGVGLGDEMGIETGGGMIRGGGGLPPSWVFGQGFDAGVMPGIQQNHNFASSGSGANHHDYHHDVPTGVFSGVYSIASHLQHPTLAGLFDPSSYDQYSNTYSNHTSSVNLPPQGTCPSENNSYQTLNFDPYNFDVMNELDPSTALISSNVTILGGAAPVSSNVSINSGTGPISSTVSIDSGTGPITSTVNIGGSGNSHGSTPAHFALLPPHLPPLSPPRHTLPPPPPRSPEVGGEGPENEQPNQDGIRRSGRAPAPSTRLKKQNEIGSNVVHPPTSQPDLDKHCAWFPPAASHVKEMELGEEFDNMIEKWEELEKSLDYGKKSKGTLPNPGGRPSEWKAWISKTRNSLRDYDHPPAITISNSPEFGIAICKYWRSLQPSFRRGEDGIWPLPIYSSPDAGSDPWDALRKGGPNGLISIITMLAWWGRASLKVPRYDEDQRPIWRRAVGDVDRCLDKMLACLLKRRSDDDQLLPRKRARRECL